MPTVGKFTVTWTDGSGKRQSKDFEAKKHHEAERAVAWLNDHGVKDAKIGISFTRKTSEKPLIKLWKEN